MKNRIQNIAYGIFMFSLPLVFIITILLSISFCRWTILGTSFVGLNQISKYLVLILICFYIQMVSVVALYFSNVKTWNHIWKSKKMKVPFTAMIPNIAYIVFLFEMFGMKRFGVLNDNDWKSLSKYYEQIFDREM